MILCINKNGGGYSYSLRKGGKALFGLVSERSPGKEVGGVKGVIPVAESVIKKPIDNDTIPTVNAVHAMASGYIGGWGDDNSTFIIQGKTATNNTFELWISRTNGLLFYINGSLIWSK